MDFYKRAYRMSNDVFFCYGKMFLKKGQNLLTIIFFLLKSIYRIENTFVYDRKTEEHYVGNG